MPQKTPNIHNHGPNNRGEYEWYQGNYGVSYKYNTEKLSIYNQMQGMCTLQPPQGNCCPPSPTGGGLKGVDLLQQTI